MTGAGMLKLATDLGGINFTGYLSPGAQADAWFSKAMIELEERLYRQIQDQRIKDELYGFTVSNFSVPIINAATNAINLGPSVAFSITSQNNFPSVGNTTYTVTTLLPHNIPIGGGKDVYISNPQGLTLLSVSGYGGPVTVVSTTVFTFVVGATPESGTYTANSGMFYWLNATGFKPLQLIDYFHLLNATATYLKPIYPPTGIPTLVTGASNTTPIVVSLFTYNNIRTGDQITFSGFTSNTHANGTHYVKKLNSLQISLYADKYFQTPIVGNGAFNPSDVPVIGRVYVKPCKAYTPDERISPLSNPSEEGPRYLESNGQLIFYPQPTSQLLALSFDYLRLPFNVFGADPNVDASLTTYPYKYIDTTNDILDFSAYYHRRFLERLPETVIDLIARESANSELLQTDEFLSQKNP